MSSFANRGGNSRSCAYRIPTRWGLWRATFTAAGLRELQLPGTPAPNRRSPSHCQLEQQEGNLGLAVVQALLRRLQGQPSELPWDAFDLQGHPPFFLRAWKALYTIPYGEARTYGQLAKAAGSPKAVRAAGQACAANPIMLFIPCHRVVAVSGIGGFGGGLEWKKRLLALEGIRLKGQAKKNGT